MRRRRRKYYDDFDFFGSQKPQRNWGKICCAILGFISAIIATLLWIALFSKIEIEMMFIYLPMSTAISYAAFLFYMKEIQDWDLICYFLVIFYVATTITSIVGGFSSDKSISGTSICNIILSAVFLQPMIRSL